MNREEAIKMLVNATYSEEWQGNEKLTTAHLMAIEALEGMCFDEWCDDCKEYDTEKKCCPRFNKVIREALKREPSDDGTLEIKVEDATKVGRVLISDDKHRGGLYYPDGDEPQGEWIHTPNGTDRDFVWWVCSECGHKIFSETEEDRIEFHAYCGRCGADMRGDTE